MDLCTFSQPVSTGTGPPDEAKTLQKHVIRQQVYGTADMPGLRNKHDFIWCQRKCDTVSDRKYIFLGSAYYKLPYIR